MRISAASSLALALALAASLTITAATEGCGGSATGAGLYDDAGNLIGGDGGADTGALPDADNVINPGVPLSVSGAYVVKTMFLGETDRNGAPVKDAWKSYGENLDGLVTTKTDTNVCQRQGGADSAKQEDGLNGIDNAFGRTVLGFILGLVPTPTKTSNDAIAMGSDTLLLTLSAAPMPRFGILVAAPTTTPPVWDGNDVRAAVQSSVVTGAYDPVSISLTPTIDGQVVRSGPASGTFYLELPLQGSAWRIPIQHARVTMTLSPDGLHATSGVIAGISPTEEMVAGIAKVAGRISTQLCGGSTLDTIKQTIRQASDIIVEGPQDPTKPCNGISIGIGFEAVKVTVKGVAPDPTDGPDPCK